MTGKDAPAAEDNPGVSSEVLAHAPEMRLSVYSIAPGNEIPWHFHSAVSDWYICREGVFAVETRSPEETTTLVPGAMHQVPVRRVHRVVNTGDTVCRFALVQGIGAYDFNPVDG